METILNDLYNINKAIKTLETSKRHLSEQLAIRKQQWKIIWRYSGLTLLVYYLTSLLDITVTTLL